MSLLDTHIGFVEALRSAGLSVSLAEGLDAISALEKVRWHDRETVRAAYAATLVKRQPQRVTFDAVFDIYYPRLIGGGVAGEQAEAATDGPPDTGPVLARFREALAEALASGDTQAMQDLAVEAVARFGAMPGRGPGLSSWSAYTSLQRVSPSELMDRLVQGLLAGGLDAERAERTAGRRIGDFTRLVEGDARRRIAEEQGPEHVVDVTVRRNAYGRQVDSFEADLEVDGIEHPVRGVFIRAPVVESVGADVRVLASLEGRPVVLEQGNLLLAAFHPELVGETGLHGYLLGRA